MIESEKPMKVIKVAFCCFLLMLPSALQAQAKRGQKIPESVVSFVQNFYDWYVPRVLNNKTGTAWSALLKSAKPYLNFEFSLKLQEDTDAQSKVQGEIAGLDFDPFLDSQDPDKHYKIGKIMEKDKIYRIDIHWVVGGHAQTKASVIAEVALNDGRWRFLDFYYPDGQDLLGVLKALKDEREKPNP